MNSDIEAKESALDVARQYSQSLVKELSQETQNEQNPRIVLKDDDIIEMDSMDKKLEDHIAEEGEAENNETEQ